MCPCILLGLALIIALIVYAILYIVQYVKIKKEKEKVLARQKAAFEGHPYDK